MYKFDSEITKSLEEKKNAMDTINMKNTVETCENSSSNLLYHI